MFNYVILKNNRGVIITYVLVFGSIFLILLGGLLGFVLFQIRVVNQKIAFNQALYIAEAGINYYKWCLNNNIEENCLSEKSYYTPQGKLIGSFSLDKETQQACGQTIQKNIISTGRVNNFYDIERKISVIYARESVARYSYILNSDVWIGSDHEIRGPYHSNLGVRFDGENQSLVTSSVENWLCTSSFGCDYLNCPRNCSRDGSTCRCPGVFSTTSVSNQSLFNYPVVPFDFLGITVDLVQIKQFANDMGVYLPPAKNINASAKGWHLIFQDNGKVEARIITDLSCTWAYSLEEDWHYDCFTITSEYTPATLPDGRSNPFNVPLGCSVIFVEDSLWPEGKINNKITVASANLLESNVKTDIILQNNIDYALKDGSNGLVLIGQRNVLISNNSPNKMEIRGVFIAQNGRFGRNHYQNNIRDSLEIYGSIISAGRVGTKWVSGSQTISGYSKRETIFDPYMVYSPPPFLPYIDPLFKLIKWQEIK